MMSEDAQLRALLVYRLEAGTSTPAFGIDEESAPIRRVISTVLAKYDYASQYETHRGTDATTIYGGRDAKFADAVSTVIVNDPPIAGEAGVLGGFKVVQSDLHQIVYGTDQEGICLAVITGLGYASRIAVQLLTELHTEFSEKFGQTAKTATANSLNKKCKPLLKSYAQRYEDPQQVDKAAAVLGKVEEVKVQMADNIADMLEGMEKAEDVVARSEQLQEQAQVFRGNAGSLKKQMKCKNLKWTLLLWGLVIGIFAAVFIPLIVKATKNKN